MMQYTETIQTITTTIEYPKPNRGPIRRKPEGGNKMQVGLNTRIELELRVRLDARVEKEKRALAQVVAEAIEKYLDEKEE